MSPEVYRGGSERDLSAVFKGSAERSALCKADLQKPYVQKSEGIMGADAFDPDIIALKMKGQKIQGRD